jgi:hypothetical protein
MWTGDASPWDDEVARGKCRYCIGAVRCAPHRVYLKIPEEKALLNRSFELRRLKIPMLPGTSETRTSQGMN